MVKRYTCDGPGEISWGECVTYSDYAVLQSALEEALRCWEYELPKDKWHQTSHERIAELRKFLEP